MISNSDPKPQGGNGQTCTQNSAFGSGEDQESASGPPLNGSEQSRNVDPAKGTTPLNAPSDGLKKIESAGSDDIQKTKQNQGQRECLRSILIVTVLFVVCLAIILGVVLGPGAQDTKDTQDTLDLKEPEMQLVRSFSERPGRHSNTVSSVVTYQDPSANNEVRIVSGSADSFVKVWSAADHTLLHTFYHAEPVLAVTVYQDPAANNAVRVVSCSNTDIKIWSAVDGSLLRTIPQGAFAVETYLDPLAENVVRIVSATLDSIRIWSAADGSLLQTISPEAGVSALATYRDPTADNAVRIVSGAFVWSASNGSLLVTLEGAVFVNQLATYPDPDDESSIRIVGVVGDSIRIWSATNGSLAFKLAGYADALATYQDPLSNNAIRIVTGSYDAVVRIWSERGSMLSILNHSGGIQCLVTYEDPTSTANHSIRIVASSFEGAIKIWSASDNSVQHTLKPNSMKMGFVTYQDEAANGAIRIASRAWDGTVHIWSESTGNLLHVLTDGSTALATYRDPLANGAVRIVSGSLGGTLEIWSAANRTLMHTLTGCSSSTFGSVNAIATYQDPTAKYPVRIVSGNMDGTVCVWAATRTDFELLNTSRCPDYAEWIFQDPDANNELRIVSKVLGFMEDFITVCSAIDGEIFHELGHSPASSLSVVTTYEDPEANNSVRIVSAIGSNVTVWSVADGGLLHTLSAHTVRALATFKDSQAKDAVRIVAGDRDLLKVWSARDGEMLGEWGSPGYVFALATYQDPVEKNRSRIISSSNGEIHLWDFR